MSSVIQNMIEQAIGDGARAAKFEVQVMLPVHSMYPNEQAITVTAKTASFPSKQHEIIMLKNKGRSIPVRGQVKYPTSWECTFYLSEDHSLKLAFERWMEAIDQKHNFDSPQTLKINDIQSFFASSETNYVMPIIVTQLNFDMDKPRAVYTLQNCFPTEIGPIQLSADSTGSLLEFTVTFATSHYLVNAVHYDSQNTDSWNTSMSSITSSALSNIGSGFLSGIESSLQGYANNMLNSVTSEITGAVTSAVDNMIQSIF